MSLKMRQEASLDPGFKNATARRGYPIFQPRTWKHYSFIRIFPYSDPGLKSATARRGCIPIPA